MAGYLNDFSMFSYLLKMKNHYMYIVYWKLFCYMAFMIKNNQCVILLLCTIVNDILQIMQKIGIRTERWTVFHCLQLLWTIIFLIWNLVLVACPCKATAACLSLCNLFGCMKSVFAETVHIMLLRYVIYLACNTDLHM